MDEPGPQRGVLEELGQREVTELDVLVIEDGAADLVLEDVKTGHVPAGEEDPDGPVVVD